MDFGSFTDGYNNIVFFQILDQVKYRVEWAKYQERERQKEEEAAERERGNN